MCSSLNVIHSSFLNRRQITIKPILTMGRVMVMMMRMMMRAPRIEIWHIYRQQAVKISNIHYRFTASVIPGSDVSKKKIIGFSELHKSVLKHSHYTCGS